VIIRHDAVDPLEFDNLRILDYTAGRDSSSSFAEITVPAGVSHKLSWSNRSDKYYYVVRGDVTFEISKVSNTLGAGDFCIVPQGARFRYTNTGSGEAVLILVHTPSFRLDCEEFED
jgi:mannose-6-phosphate isomerase-like protein (cupin superfamily)